MIRKPINLVSLLMLLFVLLPMPLKTSAQQADYYTVDWSPDGSKIAVGTGLGEVLVIDAATQQLLLDVRITKDGSVERVRWSPDGNYLAVGLGVSGVIYILDPMSGEQVHSLYDENNFSTPMLEWSPDGTMLASAHARKNLGFATQVWHVSTEDVLMTLADKAVGWNAFAWSPDGTHLIAENNEDQLVVWDVATWQSVRTLDCQAHALEVTWQPNGDKIAVLAGNLENRIEHVRICDATTGDILRTIPAMYATSVRWSSDGKRLAIGQLEQFRVVDVQSGQDLFTFDLLYPDEAAWSPDGTRLAYAGYQQSSLIIDLPPELTAASD